MPRRARTPTTDLAAVKPQRAKDIVVHLVKNSKSEGEGSFREALELSNADATRTHVIRFALPEAEAVIRPKDPFPEVKASVEIDGSVDLDGRPSVTIDGNDAGQASGLTLAGPPPSTIRGLFITGFKGSGVVLHGEGTHLVERCAIYDSSDRGVIVTSDHCVLRMLEVCGNSNGGIIVVGAKGARIQGCRIGVTCTGEEHGNGTSGVYIAQAPGNIIGPENTISGNHHYGVLIYGSKSCENHVSGNLIGTDPQGKSAIPNLRTGVLIFNAPDNVIGGLRSDCRNIISGNRRNGINIDGSATRPELEKRNPDEFVGQGGCGFAIGNTVCGNFVGTDLYGTTALPNGKHGILIFVAQGNLFGGTSPGHANVIAGNKEHGIFVLGVNPDRTDWRRFIRDPKSGELVQTVHDDETVSMREEPGNTIAGNLIGLDSTGKSMGNGGSGLSIVNAPYSVIGLPGRQRSNIISANGAHGITLSGCETVGAVLYRNQIGTLESPDSPAPNESDGVCIRDVADAVFGTGPSGENVIQFNKRRQVRQVE